jgi:outer membrane lipoprotein-sorting protein
MKKVWIALSLFLALSLALAGCGQQITAEEIVAKMQETVENTQDAHAIVSASVNAQGIELSARAEVWEQSPNKLRAQVLEASEPDLVGTLMVSDGQQGWLYEPNRNRVTVGPVEQIDTPLPQEMLTELQYVIQEMLDASDLELVGEEQVAGQQAYKLTLSPKEGAEQEFLPGNGTATLWVDKEQWIVLKATYEASNLGQGSLEVHSYEMNPGLADDLVTFEIPEGAEVVDVEAQQPTFLTLEEAKAWPAFQVLVPDYVPQGTTLIQVFEVQDTIVLGYNHSADASFTIMQGPELIRQMPSGEAQDMEVRGQTATLISDEDLGFTFLNWVENEVTITIAGRIDLEEALQVAESMK